MFSYLAEQSAARSTGGEMMIMLFLFLGMWFLLISPQRKKQKKIEEMINALKVGDKVLTSTGIFGTIRGIQPDRFEIEIDKDVTITIHRSFIQTKL